MPKLIEGPIPARIVFDQLEMSVKTWLRENASSFSFPDSDTIRAEAKTEIWRFSDYRTSQEKLEKLPEYNIGQNLVRLKNRGTLETELDKRGLITTVGGYLNGKQITWTSVVNLSALRDSMDRMSLPDLSKQSYYLWDENETDYYLQHWVPIRDADLDVLVARARSNLDYYLAFRKPT